MADIFRKCDAQKLLENKTIWFFGDSNMRGIYKDLIWLLERNTLIELSSLKDKLEASFMNDVLIKGGSLHRGRNFQEIRRYRNFKLGTTIEFTFLTQCYSSDIQERIKGAQWAKETPDVVVLNSCAWDVTRWGPESIEKYKSNITHLLGLLKSRLPSKTRVVWLTTPPISKEPRGGFFIKQIEFLKHTLRFDVMEANHFVSREFILAGFDVLDIHYHLLLQIHRRRPDGIHWNPEAVRHMTNLFLTHISFSWNVALPINFKSPLLDKLLRTPCHAFNPAGGHNSPKVPVEGKLRSAVLIKSNTRPARGKKRDYNGNIPSKKDFSNNEYRRKRFKTAGRRNF